MRPVEVPPKLMSEAMHLIEDLKVLLLFRIKIEIKMYEVQESDRRQEI